MSHEHEKLNYVEFASANMKGSKRFFEEVFSWCFEDYGPEYMAFDKQGIEGGFYAVSEKVSPNEGIPLLVFYSENLEATLEKVKKAGGEIVKDIFEFPGGRRFHFREPGGNELAVWAEPAA